jgi:predicted RNA binding protein YcfA (HicA-like mRNA interferase family)
LRNGLAVDWRKVDDTLRFSELVRMLESYGFRLLKEKGSVRYYRKPGHDRLIRVDYHGPKEVPAGTCHAILKAAGIKPGVNDD